MSAAEIAELREDLAKLQTSVALCCERITNLQADIAKLWRIVVLVAIVSFGSAQAVPFISKLIGG
jgi:hypothetical protein